MTARRSAAAPGLIALCAALVLLSAPMAGAQSPAAETGPSALTVNQAVARALANQPLIQQAQAAVEAARARVGEAQASYYPFVNGTASYNRLSDQSFSIASVLPPSVPLSSLVPPSLLPLFESPLSLVPVDNWDFSVGLNQVIYQFGKRGIQVKLAENGVAAAQIGVEQIQVSLAYQTVQVFYSVLFLRDQLAALDSQMKNLQEHLDGVHARMETGSASKYDELSTEARVTALQSQRIDAQNMLDKAEIGMRQLLGMDEAAPLALEGSFAPSLTGVPDPGALLGASLANRTEVRQAAEAESAAELGRRLVFASSLPTLSAHASFGYKTGILPNLNSLTMDWVAGVNLNVPVFQGFMALRQRDEALGKLEGARANSLAVKRTVTTQVLQAIRDVQAARSQVESAQAQLDQAQQVLEVVKVQYDLGLLTNLEYLDAQAGLERAQLGSLQAQYRNVLGEYALRQATGEKIWTAATDPAATDPTATAQPAAANPAATPQPAAASPAAAQ